jgi:hypothetical protein
MILRIGLGLVVVVGVTFGILYQLSGRHPPLFPPFRRTVRDRITSDVRHAATRESEGWKLLAPAPPAPRPAVRPGVVAYTSAIAADQKHPGALSFRADTDFYCEHNQSAVADQARKEGITVDEVKELTYFGFAMMRMTQPHKIADVIGRQLSAEESEWLGDWLARENTRFQDEMHDAVDAGASVEQRWDLIHSAEQRTIAELKQTFGMSDDQIDALLAPDRQEMRAEGSAATATEGPEAGTPPNPPGAESEEPGAVETGPPKLTPSGSGDNGPAFMKSRSGNARATQAAPR